MMNLVDSSGWIEFFRAGPNAAFFEPALTKADRLIVPTIALVEVGRFAMRTAGREAAEEALAHMSQGIVVDLDAAIAKLAAALGTSLRLPLADSIILATARARDAVVWTQDSDFQGLDGVKYVPTR